MKLLPTYSKTAHQFIHNKDIWFAFNKHDAVLQPNRGIYYYEDDLFELPKWISKKKKQLYGLNHEDTTNVPMAQ